MATSATRYDLFCAIKSSLNLIVAPGRYIYVHPTCLRASSKSNWDTNGGFVPHVRHRTPAQRTAGMKLDRLAPRERPLLGNRTAPSQLDQPSSPPCSIKLRCVSIGRLCPQSGHWHLPQRMAAFCQLMGPDPSVARLIGTHRARAHALVFMCHMKPARAQR